VITPSDLPNVDADLARALIVMARTIAPCLDSLVDGADANSPKLRSDAIAILKVIAKDARSRGVKSQQTAQGRVEYIVDSSTFGADDRDSLRSLCGAAATVPLPLGSFPRPSHVVATLFPEEC